MGCTSEEANQQAQQFRADFMQDRYGSPCAPQWWLAFVAAQKLNGSRHARIADIGCNKAYFTAKALSYLAPGYGNHLDLMYKSHAQRGIYSRPCGACSECTRVPSNLPTQGQDLVDVLCVEPSEAHVDSVTLARNSIYGNPDDAAGPPGKTRVRLHVVRGAVSNFTGEARFPKNCTVNTCSLADRPEDYIAVPVTTFDAITSNATAGWPFWDVVKIDTEGFDPTVLAGAYRTLAGHRIKTLVFGYNSVWERTGATLAQCTRYMDALGYACFFDNRVLTRLSGTCWRDDFEVKAWSRVVCTVRGTAMEGELMAGSWLAGKVPHVPKPHRHHLGGGGGGGGQTGRRRLR